jgi:hypothetical protein
MSNYVTFKVLDGITILTQNMVNTSVGMVLRKEENAYLIVANATTDCRMSKRTRFWNSLGETAIFTA